MYTCFGQCNFLMYIGIRYRKESIGTKCSPLDEDLNWQELVLDVDSVSECQFLLRDNTRYDKTDFY